MSTIILTTDLSEESRAAFPVAKKYSKALGAQILLLAIIEDPAQAAMVYAMDFPVLPDTEVQNQLRDRINKDLQQIIETDFADTSVTFEVQEAGGSVDSEIVKAASDHNAELVIMATHGRTGIARLLIGSVTERVVRHSTCPVLIVPVREEPH